MKAILLPLSIVILTLCQSQSNAVVVIGNYPQSIGSSADVIHSGVVQKAVSFTLNAQAFNIDSITLRLVDYTSSVDTPAVYFATDANDAPGSMIVGSLLSNPSSSANSAADFTFLPNGTLTLSASTKYWLVVDSSVGLFYWITSNPHVAPTGEASFGSYKYSDNSGSSYYVQEKYATFAINGTPVPEPSACALLSGLGLLTFAGWRRYHHSRSASANR